MAFQLSFASPRMLSRFSLLLSPSKQLLASQPGLLAVSSHVRVPRP